MLALKLLAGREHDAEDIAAGQLLLSVDLESSQYTTSPRRSALL